MEKVYCCPKCKTPLGYTKDDKLHVEINGKTFVLTGSIRITCYAPCNKEWRFRGKKSLPVQNAGQHTGQLAEQSRV
jgi:hypothetical protein